MTDPISLNRARKIRAKAEKITKANENAARYGRTKAERILQAAQSDKAAKKLDQHFISDED